MSVLVRFWGVRGSIPTPGPRTRRYGGNTSCLEVRSATTICIFDAGTGLRELGSALMRAPTGEGLKLHLFLSHPHWDHIQGFPFFGPAYDENTTLWVYGPAGDAKNYELLSGQMNNAYFPVRFSDLKAKVVQKSFKGDAVDVGDFVVRKFNQKHPGSSVGFRIEHKAGTVVYATDSELDLMLADPQQPITKPNSMRRLPKELVKAIKNADLLVADAQYTDEEYPLRVGWGHPRASTVVDLACDAQVRQLALSHHDPMHSDRETDVKVSLGVERAQSHKSMVEVFGAREGVVLKLNNHPDDDPAATR
jgi:phosphoribosyl 1,2-cyclic phosphodiesterase